MVPQKWTHRQTQRHTDRQTDRQTDISTYRKHWPRGPMLWKLSLVIQVPDARDRAAVVAALLQLLLQALQPSILDHGGLQSYHGFSLIIDLRPENTLQVILKKHPNQIQCYLKVPWHEIFLFQNMLPIDALIRVAFLFFQVLLEHLAQIQSF